MEISKVIIPAAGKGAQFLPFSKTVPREMLPLLQKPALQHIAEEALASELATMILITGQRKEMLSDHFDLPAHNTYLQGPDEAEYLSACEKISRQAHIISIKQQEPLGLGHAIWLARHCINKEYFGVALPDDIIFGKQPALSQLIRVARQEKVSVIAVQEVPSHSISSYGVIGIKKTITPNLFQVSHVVEKPTPKDAPSSLAIVGRYILSSKIITALTNMVAYDQEDISLTEALGHMMHNNERIFAYKIQGTRYDIGTPLGWVQAVISTSLQDAKLGPPLRSFIANLDSHQSVLYHPAKKMSQDTI